MEIFLKNKKGQLEETTLYNILLKALEKNYDTEEGKFDGENYNWINIIRESKKQSQVTICFAFEDDFNTIDEINIYEAPIKRIVVEDEMNQII